MVGGRGGGRDKLLEMGHPPQNSLSTVCTSSSLRLTEMARRRGTAQHTLHFWECKGASMWVRITTRYWLDDQGIESRWRGEIFRFGPDQAWGPSSLLYKGHWLSFPGLKRPRRGVDHPLPFSANVQQTIELYLCSPF